MIRVPSEVNAWIDTVHVANLFVCDMMVGVVCGAYSSVCITGALWYTMKERQQKKENA